MRLPRRFFSAVVLLAIACTARAESIAPLIKDVSKYSNKGSFVATARAVAEKQAQTGKGLGYRSTQVERKTFTGKFKTPKLLKGMNGNQIYGMAIFSDDGCKVTVDGDIIDDKAGVGQTLQKLDQSFHELPILLSPEQEVTITVEYTNTFYTGKGDIDGVSLLVFLVPLKANVTEVSFQGAKYSQVISDDATQIYKAPHWVDKNGDGKPVDAALGEHNYPVAFTRNTKPEIKAQFEIKNPPKGAVCKARAGGSDGVSVPETAVPAGKQITLPFTAAAKPWANTVKFYTTRPAGKSFTPFTLVWELSFNNGKTWRRKFFSVK